MPCNAKQQPFTFPFAHCLVRHSYSLLRNVLCGRVQSQASTKAITLMGAGDLGSSSRARNELQRAGENNRSATSHPESKKRITARGRKHPQRLRASSSCRGALGPSALRHLLVVGQSSSCSGGGGGSLGALCRFLCSLAFVLQGLEGRGNRLDAGVNFLFGEGQGQRHFACVLLFC